MHLFYQPDAALQPFLSEEESRHCVKTLRLTTGDPIWVTDGAGNRFDCRIEKADPRRCTFRIVDRQQTPPRPYRIELALAPTKNGDRIEWLVEKAVELGIDRIRFFASQHSERRALKTDRLEKIAIAAMKQSLQSWLPAIDPLINFENILTGSADYRYIAHLPEGQHPPHLWRAARQGGTTIVLIGPEGDFSAPELERAVSAGFELVTLGNTRLRTETAALAACHIINLINEP